MTKYLHKVQNMEWEWSSHSSLVRILTLLGVYYFGDVSKVSSVGDPEASHSICMPPFLIRYMVRRTDCSVMLHYKLVDLLRNVSERFLDLCKCNLHRFHSRNSSWVHATCTSSMVWAVKEEHITIQHTYVGGTLDMQLHVHTDTHTHTYIHIYEE